MKPLFALAVLSLLAGPAAAEPALSAAMQPLSFLVGHWTSLGGKAEGGRTATGVTSIEPAAGGAALLRRDRTDLSGAGGKGGSSFEQVMLIYPEGGTLHGDYFDGEHVIHYISATVVPGKSVSFDTADVPGPPRFRLTYTAEGADKLAVKFEMKPPGAPAYQTIAAGEKTRD